MSDATLNAVAKSLRFIESHLEQELGVRDVANAVNYSQFYFSREFARHTHISVYDYILRRKLSESYKALFSERCKIVDLACRYGFQSHEVYTRAFRKMFGENPSEAAVYKPLAIFEAIDGAYLDFLSGLRIEPLNESVESYQFEIAGVMPVTQPEKKQDYLALFAPENRFQCSCILHGRLHSGEREHLSIRLDGLHRILRIHHPNPQFALRYYTDHYHGDDTTRGNYVVMQTEQQHLDLLVSCL